MPASVAESTGIDALNASCRSIAPNSMKNAGMRTVTDTAWSASHAPIFPDAQPRYF